MVGNVEKFLAQVPLLEGFGQAALADLQSALQPVQAEIGECLFKQGERSDGMYLLRSGRVSIEVRTPGDEVLTLSSVGSGELLGELAMLDAGLRSASARVTQPMEGYFISRDRFDLLKSDLRPAGKVLTVALLRGLGINTQKLIRSLYKNDSVASHSMLDLGDPVTDPLPCGLDVLRQFPCFYGFNEQEISEFVERYPRYRVRAGSRLHGFGDSTEGFYGVLRGALRSAIESAGENQQLAVHGPGQFVGFLELVTGGRRAAIVAARENTEMLFISTADFSELLSSDSPLTFKLLSNLCAKAAEQLRKVNNIASRVSSFERFNS